jgi:N-acyl-D-aspartate/D-glutamate deacylase
VIDPHTHYDAQVFWDPWCTNSGWHGVTSVVVGNCGFGFMPCRPEHRDRYMDMMETTEQIPAAVLRVALPWDWQTFPEWMASIKRTPKGINLGGFLPLNSLMIWVMGLDAAKSRSATDEERAEMRRLLHEAMDHGAMGFGFSFLQLANSHKDSDGSPMPTDVMDIAEAYNLATVLRERGEGTIQALVEVPGVDHKAEIEELARISGRPVLHTVIMAIDAMPSFHKDQLVWLDEMEAKGLDIYAQALAMRGWNEAQLQHWDVWQGVPLFAEFQAAGNPAARAVKAADPDYRDRHRAG